MAYQWSAKQRHVQAQIDDTDVSVILASGPVQSGKTLSLMFFWLSWVCMNWSGYEFALCARSQRQFEAIIGRYAREFSSVTGLRWLRKDEHYELESAYGAAPNRFYVGLGTDIRSESKVRGWTLAGAFLDEVTLMPEDFVDTIHDRCSVNNYKIAMACNPSGPMHPVKVKFIDPKADDVSFIPFELADNPSLGAAYIAGLHKRYSGTQLRRMVYGEWAASSGLVYPNWGKALAQVPDVRGAWRYRISADHASASVTHAILWALFPNGSRWAVKEWRYDGRNDGQLTEGQQAEIIKDTLVRGLSISEVTVDPAALGFRKALSRALDMPVMEAINDVLPGIRKVSDDIDTGLLRIDPHACPELVREGYNYTWDERAGLLGMDKPMKLNDHGMDAMRYDTWTHAAPIKHKVKVLSGKGAPRWH